MAAQRARHVQPHLGRLVEREVAHAPERHGIGGGAGGVDPRVQHHRRHLGPQARHERLGHDRRVAVEGGELVLLHGVLPAGQAVELEVHQAPAEAGRGVDGHEPNGGAAVREQRRDERRHPDRRRSRAAAPHRSAATRKWNSRAAGCPAPGFAAQERREDLLPLEGHVGGGQARHTSEGHMRRLRAQEGDDAVEIRVVDQPRVQQRLEAGHAGFDLAGAPHEVEAQHDQAAEGGGDGASTVSATARTSSDIRRPPRSGGRSHPALQLRHEHAHVERFRQVVERAGEATAPAPDSSACDDNTMRKASAARRRGVPGWRGRPRRADHIEHDDRGSPPRAGRAGAAAPRCPT
jgi:hypothetical protein